MRAFCQTISATSQRSTAFDTQLQAAMSQQAADDASQPIPTRGRLTQSWGDALARTDKPKLGGDACWGGAATLAEELALLGDFMAPRRIEDAVEQGLVNAVSEACKTSLGSEAFRIGPPTQCRLSGDPALLCCVTSKSVWKSNCRGASPPLLNHGFHAIDATSARRRGGVVSHRSIQSPRPRCRRKDLVKNYRCTRLTG